MIGFWSRRIGQKGHGRGKLKKRSLTNARSTIHLAIYVPETKELVPIKIRITKEPSFSQTISAPC